MAAGGSRDITVTGTAATIGGTYTNTATVLGNETDPEPGNDSASADTNVTSARLVLAKSVAAAASHTGGGLFAVAYRVTVTNNGTAAGSYTTLLDAPAFDPRLTVLGATAALNGAAATPVTAGADGAFTLNTASRELAVGATDTYDVVVRFEYAGDATASAAACAGAPGTGLYNAATLTSADAAVAAADACAAPPPLPADLALTKTGPAEARPGAGSPGD